MKFFSRTKCTDRNNARAGRSICNTLKNYVAANFDASFLPPRLFNEMLMMIYILRKIILAEVIGFIFRISTFYLGNLNISKTGLVTKTHLYIIQPLWS